MLAQVCAAIAISISAPADVSPTLVNHVLDESNAIWRPAGLTLVAERTLPPAPTLLAIVIGPERGQSRGAEAPLGWIQFSGGRPQPTLYLSLTNVVSMLEASRGVVGAVSRMPLLERETYLGRALGRALAHELGHYLLASTAHTTHGLMKANFTAAEFFSTDTRQFAIGRDERTVALARVDQLALIASATSGSSSPTSPRPATPPRATARWQGPLQD